VPAAALLLQLSTVIGAAIPEERAERKWIEGIAIWCAIFLVTLVSECCHTHPGAVQRPAFQRAPTPWLVPELKPTLAVAPAHTANQPTHPRPLPGAVNDYQKDLQFRKLNAQKDVIDIKV
jgi:hypothetical protein